RRAFRASRALWGVARPARRDPGSGAPTHRFSAACVAGAETSRPAHPWNGAAPGGCPAAAGPGRWPASSDCGEGARRSVSAESDWAGPKIPTRWRSQRLGLAVVPVLDDQLACRFPALARDRVAELERDQGEPLEPPPDIGVVVDGQDHLALRRPHQLGHAFVLGEGE